jgi:predicted LPLAT superfamily acyltransferase
MNRVHWSHIKEQGGMIGLTLSWWCYRLLGRKLCYLLAYSVATYYYLFCGSARTASKEYLQYIAAISHTKPLSSFKHFTSFAKAIVDKMAAWCHDIPLDKIHMPNQTLFKEIIATKRGGIILTAHIGNIEVARSLCRLIPDVKINALMSKFHATQFKAFLQRINTSSVDHIIYLEDINLENACIISDKIEQGEFIAIAADRTSPTQTKRNIAVNFLNQSVLLPQGPFVLSKILNCPSYFMSCVKENDTFKIYFDEVESSDAITDSAQNYAHRIEDLCNHYPLQWFNFFDFFRLEGK